MYKENGKWVFDIITLFLQALIVGMLAGLGWGIHNINNGTTDLQISEAKKRYERSAFYGKYHCKPEGYVATRYEPERTYKCDNGTFIARDMKEN